MNFLLTAMARIIRPITEFELSYAQYRQDRIDNELAFGAAHDIGELIARKSNISSEIHTLREHLCSLDTQIYGSI